MPQQEHFGFSGLSTHLQYLRAIKHLLVDTVRFHGVSLKADCLWAPHSIAFAAILWAWSDHRTLLDRFEMARKITSRLSRSVPDRCSYQSFIKLLVRHTEQLSSRLIASLRQRMKSDLRSAMQIRGRDVFAVDGTKVLLPKTRSNEKAYAKTRKRKQTRKDVGAKTDSGHLRNKVPQFYVTVLWNVGTGLLWSWRAGPSNASETEHLEEMIDDLPDRSVVVADAGFIGYDLWESLISRGHGVVIRVGANVKLIKKLGFCREYGSTVLYWPKAKRKSGSPPLVFRLVKVDGGKHPVYLITNLTTREFPDRAVLELYRKRWGIELYYRSFKCSYGRGKLRSHNAANAKCELTWSLIGIWCAGLIGLLCTEIAPAQLSMARVIRAIQYTIRDYRCRIEPGEDLLERLEAAKIDTYKRKSRTCRHPTILTRNYRASRCPRIEDASDQERRKVEKMLPIWNEQVKKG